MSKIAKILILIITIVILMFLAYSVLPSKLLYLKFILSTYKTPLDTVQNEIPSTMNRARIEIPVIIYKITSPEPLETYRNEDNIINITKKASNILSQADIKVKITEIRKLDISANFDENQGPFIEQLIEYMKTLPDYNTAGLKIIFVRRDPLMSFLQAGGAASKKDNTAYVLDRYSKDDFFIMAHEIGHLLGLDHRNSSDPAERNRYLMDDGLLLTRAEAETIYENAKSLLDN